MSCARPKAAGGQQKHRRPYQKSGYYGLKARLKGGGVAVLDGRTQAARALADERQEFASHLGGAPSATQVREVEGVLMLDLLIAAGVTVLQELGPIDRRKHTYRPVARELAGLIEKRHRILADLGWERRTKALNVAEEFALVHASREKAPRGAQDAHHGTGGGA